MGRVRTVRRLSHACAYIETKDGLTGTGGGSMYLGFGMEEEGRPLPNSDERALIQPVTQAHSDGAIA